MKKIEPWLYAALLVGTLICARAIWKGVAPDEMTRVVLFDPGAGGLTEMRWEAPDSSAILSVIKPGKEPETMVRAGKRPKIEPPAPAEPETPPAEGADKPADEKPAEEKAEAEKAEPEKAEVEKPATEEPAEAQYGEPVWREFPGSKTATTLVTDATPLTALRQFENVQPAEMEAMGFDKPVGTLSVKAAGGELSLEIGANAFGSNNAYARKPGGKTVYLLASKVVAPIKDAENRLMDRRLYAFDSKDVVRADIIPVSGEKLSAVHQMRDDEEKDFWARPDSPNEADDNLEKVLTRLLRTTATTYPTDAEKVEEARLFVPMRVVFHGETAKLGDVEIGGIAKPRDVPVEGESLPEDDPEKNPPVDFDWYARSDRTKIWVPISRTNANEVSEALKTLLGK